MGFFDTFLKKEEEAPNQVKVLIEKLGIDNTALQFANVLNENIGSEEIAIQFILEELDAASKGNAQAINFVSHSGFDEEDYASAMQHSFEEVDGVEGPQQFLHGITMALYPDQNMMIQLRIKIIDRIMQIWEIGRYKKILKDSVKTRILKETQISLNDISLIIENNSNDIERIVDGGRNGNLNCQIFLSQVSIMSNSSDAEYWTRLAAERDDADSQANLAKIIYDNISELKSQYRRNNDIDIDLMPGIKAKLEESLYWYKQAYKNGNISAKESVENIEGIIEWANRNINDNNTPSAIAYKLGCDYYTGYGVEKDYEKAISYLIEAANYGNVEAYYNLGVIYCSGEGIEPDIERAKKYYEKACELGDSEACCNLALLFYDDENVSGEDLKKAKIFFKKAIDLGNEEAVDYYKDLEQEGH